MRLSKIEKHSFIFRRYDFVAPMMRFRFVPRISSKNGQRIAMIPIPGDHLPTCVAAGENDCQHERCHGPKVGSVRCADRTPQRGVPTKEDQLDIVNSQIVERINASGRAYFTQTKLKGSTVMRIGLGNILTTEQHLRNVWRLIQLAADELNCPLGSRS